MRRRMISSFLSVLYCTTLVAEVANPTLPAPAATTPTPIPAPPPASRGQLLYENHCQVCHESVVHVRQNRRADSIEQIQTWVTRWSTHLNLTWSAEEVAAVVDYLNTRYYLFNGAVHKKE